MVEIRKRGQAQHNFGRDVKCQKCLSEMRYQANEGRFVSDRDGNAKVYDCPVCHKEIWVAV